MILVSGTAVNRENGVEMNGALEISPQAGSSEVLAEDDIELRTRIVNAIASGNLDTALSETEKYYPTVLEKEEGLMMFKLRCRKFVELIIEATELKKKMGGIGRE